MDESVTVAGAESRRGQVALVLLLAILAAVVAVPIALGGSDEDLRPLGLVPGGARDEASGAPAADMMYPYQQIVYELDGDLPDLGDEGPVWQLVRPAMDATRAGELAAALGAPGEVKAHDGGFSVNGDEAAAEFYLSGGAWMVSVFGSYGDEVEVRPPVGGEPGSSGGGSTGTDSSTGTAPACPAPEPGLDPAPCDDVIQPPPVECIEATGSDGTMTKECSFEGVGTPIPPDVIYEEPPMEGPEDLPSAAEAEKIARDLLDGAGVLTGEVVVEVTDGGVMSSGVACADPVNGAESVECEDAVSETTVLSRNVTFTALLGGRRVEGLSWSVEVGDHGDIQGVWGTYAEVEEVGDYPLRPIDEAYAAMVAGELPYYGGPMPLGGVYMDDALADGSAVVVGGDASVDDSGAGNVEGKPEVEPKPDPVCSNDGCAVPGGPGDDVVCVTDPCPGGDDPPPPVGCKVQPDGSEICETPPAPGDDIQCGIAPCELPSEPPVGCKVQPDGSEICEAPVPGEPPVCIDDPGLTPEPLPAEDVPVAPQTSVGAGTDGSGGGGHGDEDILIAPAVPCDVTEPPMPVDPPIGCKVQPDGSEICEPIEEPPFEPEPMVVKVTGATLGAMVVPALAEDGSETAYVVPTYVFEGSWANGEDWSQPVVAVGEEWIGSPVTTTVVEEPTTTMVDPGPTTTVVDPDCIDADGVDRCVEPTIPPTSMVEPPVTIEPSPPCVVQPDGSEICEFPSTTVPPTTMDPGLTPEPVPAELQ